MKSSTTDCWNLVVVVVGWGGVGLFLLVLVDSPFEPNRG